MVPQEIALYSHLTIRENLDVLGRLAGVPAQQLGARVTEALQWAGLADRAEALAPTLSGGMRRRVNLVASTLHQPVLLLLDEPTVGVDAEARSRLHDLLLSLRASGVALLVATHDLDEATRLCDRVAVMAGGRVLRCDSVAGLVGPPRRELTITLDADPHAAVVSVLTSEGFVATGTRQWVRTTDGSFADISRIEQRLQATSASVFEVQSKAPGLAGAIAALLQASEDSAA